MTNNKKRRVPFTNQRLYFTNSH